jgi:adenosylhomocysteine nucleosidase
MGSFNDMLRRQDGYIERVAPDGSWLPTATIAGVEVMLIQTHRQGSRSAQAAVERLKQWHSPNFIVVAGIAGAIEPTVRIGDVVLADEVVYYDARRIGPAGTRHRGQHLVAPPVVGNRLNAFFAAHRGDFAMAATAGGSFMVRRGLLGSGDAVIADADAEIRLYLADYNDKVLAVETESAGVAQAVYEQPESDSPVKGWMAVRGISDRADPAKSDDAHAMAATHAAAVFAEFVPFLAAGGSR